MNENEKENRRTLIFWGACDATAADFTRPVRPHSIRDIVCRYIEVNAGQDRCGVEPASDAAVEMALEIVRSRTAT